MNFYDIFNTEKQIKYTLNNSNNRPIICVQGLGFVGSAMSLAIANARNNINEPLYNVIGVELSTQLGLSRIESLNNGVFPFETNDLTLKKVIKKIHLQDNFVATSNNDVFKIADITVVDIQCDVKINGINSQANIRQFAESIKELSLKVRKDCLVIIETTVPPGTCEKIILPIFKNSFKKRKLNFDKILLAHSYERVMPGKNYFNSIVNYWRVFSGNNYESVNICRNFFSTIINVKKFPLTELDSMTASETAKVLENSYRAVNIAFIDEWSRFAEKAKIDLYKILEAIKIRPTHSNIMSPGFGVGGYCLTKDPLFGLIGSRDILKIANLSFPMSVLCVEINNNMPLATINRIKLYFKDDFKKIKNILLMGVSYRSDVGDTRSSPSEILYNHAKKLGINVHVNDPIVDSWAEVREIDILKTLPNLTEYDIQVIIFAVSHTIYKKINFKKWLNTNVNNNLIIIDANKVLTIEQVSFLNKSSIKFLQMGVG